MKKSFLFAVLISFAASLQAFNSQSPLNLEQMRDHCEILFNLDRATGYKRSAGVEIGKARRMLPAEQQICDEVFKEMMKKMNEYMVSRTVSAIQ